MFTVNIKYMVVVVEGEAVRPFSSRFVKLLIASARRENRDFARSGREGNASV